ncbi:MAG TPA: hypothetical protein VK658_27965 [Chryseolinea sp.]|nr:hypothetical protein [Chryseolinea sp.]
MCVMRILSLVCVLSLMALHAMAQEPVEKDTSRTLEDIAGRTKISRELLEAISRQAPKEGVLNLKSEEIFLPYDGKIIRRIIINHVGFEKSITDTTSHIRNLGAKIANAVHVNSREWLIRDHLLFSEKRELNAYALADNERFLRDLDFIVDARIFVVPLSSTEDSVDVLVITRDVFSIGGRVSPRSTDKFSFRVYDVNVGGAGQRMQYNGLYDHDRTPTFGSTFFYRKSSVAGTFINLSAGVTQLNDGISLGDESESSTYFRLDRPLVSAYSHFAGALELSKNSAHNFYNEPDSLYKNYGYNVYDAWLGYNLGVRNNRLNRNRHFVSARVYQYDFTEQPEQEFDRANPIFNTQTAVLGAFTIFKQDFYKTQYVLGFGRTEDVPYGHSYAALLGWQRLMGEDRAYVGVDVEKSFVRPKGNFYTLSLRMGAFPYQSRLEDATILLYGQLFSRLYHFKRFMLRRTITADFTYVFNQRTNTLLDIEDSYGLEGFRADSVLGTKRLHARYETTLYTPWKFLGFHFAPLAFVDLAMLAPKGKLLWWDSPYLALGGGVRTRNENLVFGTVELKFFYYPKTAEDMSTFKVQVTTNLRIKYSASFVRAPSFILYN